MRPDFGCILKNARLERCFTQKELGERTGIAQHLISDYERNNRVPSIDNLAALLTALDIAPADILDIPNREFQVDLKWAIKILESALGRIEPDPTIEPGLRYALTLLRSERAKNIPRVVYFEKAGQANNGRRAQ